MRDGLPPGRAARSHRRLAVRSHRRLAALLPLLVAIVFPADGRCQIRGETYRPVRLGESYTLVAGATVIDGTGEAPRPNSSVLILNGEIVDVGAVGEVFGPPGTRVVPAHGKYLLPGFVDVRARARDSATLETLLAHGITAIRSPVTPVRDGVDYRAVANSGDVPAPRMKASGPVIDAPPGVWPESDLVETEEDVREAVRRQAAAGADFVELYVRLPPRLVAAAVDEAHRLGLPVAGDLVATSWIEAARAGIDHLSHVVSRSPALLGEEAAEAYGRDVAERRSHPYYRWLEEVEVEGPRVDEMVGGLLMRDVSVAPALAVTESVLLCADAVYREEVASYWPGGAWPEEGTVGPGDGDTTGATGAAGRASPGTSGEAPPDASGNASAAAEGSGPAVEVGCVAERWPADFTDRARAAWPKALALVRLLYEEGVLLAAGSDAPLGRLPPGASFHRELELLAGAGIPPLRVLRIATRNGAAVAGILDRAGSIEPGKRADLVLLAGDPAADIRNTRRIEWVMLGGTIYSPVEPADTSR